MIKASYTDYRRKQAVQYLKSQIIRYFSKFSNFIQFFLEFLTVGLKLLHVGTTISEYGINIGILTNHRDSNKKKYT